jgi:hypothetical protein
MKLTGLQMAEIEKEFGMVPVPDDSPATPLLNRHFGDHTFYVADTGLLVWDWNDPDDDREAVLVQVATWSDDDKSSLVQHGPKRLDVVVTLPESAGH